MKLAALVIAALLAVPLLGSTPAHADLPVRVGTIEVDHPGPARGAEARQRALRRLVERVASQRLARRGPRPAVGYDVDLFVLRHDDRGHVRYETRALVIERHSRALRHVVRAVARQRVRGRRGGLSEARIAAASARRAMDDALALVSR